MIEQDGEIPRLGFDTRHRTMMADAHRVLESLIKGGHTVYIVISGDGLSILNDETGLNLKGSETDIQFALEKHFGAKEGQITYYDEGYMYVRSFQDPDGHLWEYFWMDETMRKEGDASAASGDCVLTVTRTFEAPLKRVWSAFTELDRLQRWWGPKGSTWLSGTLDFKPYISQIMALPALGQGLREGPRRLQAR